MKTIDNHKYSRKPFSDYKIRYKVVFDIYGSPYNENLDIYSTNEDRNDVEKVIGELVNKVNVRDWEIVHSASKQQDENSAKMIDEFIKEL